MTREHIGWRKDALDRLRRSGGRRAARLIAKIVGGLGQDGEARGQHERHSKDSCQYEQADRVAVDWMLDEYAQTQRGFYELAEQYLASHPGHPGSSRPASVARLAERAKRLSRSR